MHHKISPSSLTFLFEDCRRCFYMDNRKIWKRPYSPMPSVFNRIDKVMRLCYHNSDPQLIDPTLPAGSITTVEQKIQSVPIPVGNSTVQISGKLDALAVFDGNDVGIIDFKTSEAKDKSIGLYRRQLHAYAAILSNPAKGSPLNPVVMGLICVSPESMVSGDRQLAMLQMQVSWVPIEIDWGWWNEFLADLVSLLDGDEPEGKPDCPYCAMQRAMQPNNLMATK